MNISVSTLVGFFQNKEVLAQVEETAASSSFHLINVADETAVGPSRTETRPESPGEKLTGRTGKLFEQITEWQPALILFDCENTAVPWQRWIPTLKTSPATRRFPILTISSKPEDLKEAKRLGSNFAASTEEFKAEAGNIIKKYARIHDHLSLQATCQQPLPQLVVQGLELFNQGEYYKCHDSLEAAWMEDKTPGRNLYRGVLQVGIAYFQIQRGNYRGAVKMLLRVRQWLDPLPEICRGIHVADLRQNALAVQQALTELGPDHIDQFDESLFKPIRFET